MSASEAKACQGRMKVFRGDRGCFVTPWHPKKGEADTTQRGDEKGIKFFAGMKKGSQGFRRDKAFQGGVRGD